MWRDDEQPRQFGFELKTDKQNPATYFKKDISQAHDHLQWMAQANPECAVLGLAFVGPAGIVHEKANPSAQMSLCLVPALVALREELLALVEDLRNRTPVERLIAIYKETEQPRWKMEHLLDRIGLIPLSD